ncbi:nucleotide-binding alpha-beta plait domain-containing protein [Tanacetum coccineum]
MRDKATSFFFTNFLDDWDTKALWRMFGRYGKVVDVYIAFKKTKKNTRFGFVRFINFGHIDVFEKRLKEIIIGDSRLVINHAKFFKGGDLAFPPLDFPPLNNRGLNKPTSDKSHPSHSFREIVAGFIPRGIPPLGRNVGAIKSILNEYGHVLEIGRLDFESKFLHPIKSLVLINDMNDIRHTLYVSLNGKSYPIRVFKEWFDVSNLVPSCSSSVDGSSFEEEYVGPTMDMDNDYGDDFSSKFP